MFTKQCLIVALVSINSTMLAMDAPNHGAPINSENTQIQTDALLINSTGPNTFHTHQKPTFIAQKLNDNPVFNAAGILAKAAAEGAVQGVFQGAMQGIGGVLAQKIIANFNESTDEKDARQILSKNQQVVNLASLRDEVNNFYVQTKDDEELTLLAHELRLGYGHALLAFIEKQKSEDVSIITPLLHKVQTEVNAFITDTQGTEDQDFINLRKTIQKHYGLLLFKQLQYEKESSKPAIVIHSGR